MSRLIAFDVETKIVEGESGAWRKGAAVVMVGYAFRNAAGDIQTRETVGMRAWDDLASIIACEPVTLVGFNMAFDLLHILNERPEALATLLHPNLTLYDAQIADYLIQGSRVVMPSLEESGARYGVPIVKDEWAASKFKAGIGADVLLAEDAPRLTAYLGSDTTGTLLLAETQRRLIASDIPKLRPVVRTQMESLRFCVLCTHTGVPIDADKLRALTQQARITAENHSATEAAALDALLSGLPQPPPRGGGGFNPASPPQLSALLFGGTVEYQTRIPNGVTKTGKKPGTPRYRIERQEITFPGFVKPSANPSVGEHALSRIVVQERAGSKLAPFLTATLRARQSRKVLSTYYEAISRRIALSRDGRLYGSLNQTVTNTGRKSSSEPNLQNIPDEVRAIIAPADGWVIVTADFKQLEVVVLAYLSRCPALMQAILDGKDIHAMIKSGVDKRVGREVPRTDIKRIVFGRFYGGGAVELAAQAGVPASVAQAVIDQLDTLFPGAAVFFKRIERMLRQAHRGDGTAYLTLPSGRRLGFKKTPQGGWPFTEIKNRPVQSFATADIVPFAEQLYMAWLRADPDRATSVRPIIPVHDEIVSVCKGVQGVEAIMGFYRKLRAEMVDRLNEWYRLDPLFDLPLDMSVGVGHSWLEAKNNAEVLR